MAVSNFTPTSFIIRLLLSTSLVFSTYNPVDPWSFYHWAIQPLISDIQNFTILKGLVGVALLISWGVFISATFNSMGFFGTVLMGLFFGLGFWWMIDQGWISLTRTDTLTWLVLAALSLVLAAGISWSHIRRRLTGQLDVDDVEH